MEGEGTKENFIVFQTEWPFGWDHGGYTLLFRDLQPERGSVASRLRLAIQQEVEKLDCEEVDQITMGGGFNWGDGLSLLTGDVLAQFGLILFENADFESADHDEVIASCPEKCG